MALNVEELNQKLLDLIDRLEPHPKGDKGMVRARLFAQNWEKI